MQGQSLWPSILFHAYWSVSSTFVGLGVLRRGVPIDVLFPTLSRYECEDTDAPMVPVGLPVGDSDAEMGMHVPVAVAAGVRARVGAGGATAEGAAQRVPSANG